MLSENTVWQLLKRQIIKLLISVFNQPKTIPDIVKIIRKPSRDVNASKVYRKQTGAQKNVTTKIEYQSNITYDRLKQRMRYLIYLLDN